MLVGGNDDAKYVVVFDPLDGSSNIDASIPTGDSFRCLAFAVKAGLPLPSIGNSVTHQRCAGSFGSVVRNTHQSLRP